MCIKMCLNSSAKKPIDPKIANILGSSFKINSGDLHTYTPPMLHVVSNFFNREKSAQIETISIDNPRKASIDKVYIK